MKKFVFLFAAVAMLAPLSAKAETCAPNDYVCEARQLAAEAGASGGQLTVGQAKAAAVEVDSVTVALKTRIAELEVRSVADGAVQRELIGKVAALHAKVVGLERLAQGLRFAAASTRARGGSDDDPCGVSLRKLSSRINAIRQLRAAVRELSRQGMQTAADAAYAKTGVEEHERRLSVLETRVGEIERQGVHTAGVASRASVGVDELHRRLSATELTLRRWGFAPTQTQALSLGAGLSGIGKDAAFVADLSFRGFVTEKTGGLIRGRFIGGIGSDRGNGGELLVGGWYSPYGESYLWIGAGGALETFAEMWRAQATAAGGWSLKIFGPLSLEIEGAVTHADKTILRLIGRFALHL